MSERKSREQVPDEEEVWACVAAIPPSASISFYFSSSSSSPQQSLLRVPFARLRRSTRRTGGGGGGEEKGALDDYSAGEDSFEKMHARNGEEFPEIRERSSSSSNEEGRNYHAI